MYLQSIKSVKQNAAKSVNRSTEIKADIQYRVWCLYYSSFVHGALCRTVAIPVRNYKINIIRKEKEEENLKIYV
jgi:hypothetical protein